MSEILVLAEHKNGKVKKVTYEILGKADELAEAMSLKVGVAVLGDDLGFANELKSWADRLYLLESCLDIPFCLTACALEPLCLVAA